MKRIPFTVDRRCGTTLIKQLVDGFRLAIEMGVFKPGDKLPPFREIASETGACLIVVREAFKRLAAEGLVCPRRGVGSIVLDPSLKLWRGHIVIASVEVRENHLISAMTGALRQTLMKAGYLVSFVPFGTTPGNYDFSHLESVMRTSAVTLVIATSCTPKIETVLSKFKIPFVVFGNSQKASGCVRLDTTEAVKAFVNHCVAAGVRKVTEITVGSNMAVACKELDRAGIECERWPIISNGGIEEISRSTLAAFYERIRTYGRKWLPEVLYFNDNFASQSALLALIDSGIKIPEDVRLVTWSNAGEGPYWRKGFTRIEIDPFESGRIFARHVLAFLEGDGIPKSASLEPKYIIGETFTEA